MRRIETYDWWPELVRKKDELSLRELAERFDVTPGAISAAFKRKGLSRKAAPPGPRIRRKAQSADDLPPEPGDEEEGEDGQVSDARPGSKDSRILAHLDLLGKVPDSEVAKRAGVSVRTVASFRARHQVGGYKGPRKRGADRVPRKSRIDAFAHMIGQVPDRAVAEQAGVTTNAVRNYRMRHGIDMKSQEESDTSKMHGASTASGGAWRVVIGGNGHARVVVASSLSDAASRVEEAGVGPILALEWIGEVL